MLLGAVLLLLFAQTAAAAPVHPAKIVVIGIDGVSLNLLQPFSERGITPNLGALLATGASGHLESIWPLRTPQVWTSVATGKLPGQHGIWDHVSDSYFNPPSARTKDRQRVTSEQRRSKALWTLLDAQNITTLTVGWMAAWPAEALKHGVMVAPIELMGDPRQSTIKGSFFRDAERLVTPDRLWPEVRGLITEPSEISDQDLIPFAEVPPPDDSLYRVPKIERYVYALRWSLARAKSVEAITVHLAKQTQPEVVLAYFQCPDSLLHRFWIFSEPLAEVRERMDHHGISADRAEELKKRFGNVVEACYRDVDARVGRILETLRGPQTLVMVVSDHGFGHALKPHQLADEPFSGDHLDQGVIIAAGPGIAARAMVEKASVLDITPTLLHYIGNPVADDMRGKVIESLYTPAFRDAHPLKRIATYETTAQLDAPHAEGWPPRKVPPRPTAAQMAE